MYYNYINYFVGDTKIKMLLSKYGGLEEIWALQ